TTTTKETKTVASIAAGGNASVSFTKTYVTGIEITVKNAVSNVRITVENLLTRPSSIPDVLDQIFSAGSNLKTFKYLSISVNIDDSNIDNAKITFKVDKSWLTENKVDKSSVKLARYHDGWDSLSTDISSEDGNYVYYVATTPGFSTFAIIGEEIIAATDEVTLPKETISDDESTLKTDVVDEEEPESKSFVIFIVIALLLAIIAVVAYYKREEINKMLKK
ncbi:MAG: PGF-pre-PGF domain-containing protein, partial [Methanosarcinaceae archaeon]|nr:PGF-pre-PGF domain-containing protein [Methanosarcinaceae archaeon]